MSSSYVAVDADGVAFIFTMPPLRCETYWFVTKGSCCYVSSDAVLLLTGRRLTWEDGYVLLRSEAD